MEYQSQPHIRTFFELSSRLHPALQAMPAAADERTIVIGSDNVTTLQALYEHWRGLYPEAGPAYWSVRCWTLLIWQPAFLAVTGVHGLGSLPPLSRLRQVYREGIVAGVRLPEQGWQQDEETYLITEAGRLLRSVSEELWLQLNQVTRQRHLNALRLLADTLLTALMGLDRLQPAIDQQRLLELSERWLNAAGLDGQSALMAVPLPDGQHPLALNRKGCCMDYRRHDGAVCASCPIQKLPVRIQRLQKELAANADA